MRIQRVGTARKTARTPKHPSGAFAHPTGEQKIGMSTARKIGWSGGGPAAVAAALAAKQQDAAAEVMLINDEAHEPYEKPPLSKAVLTGKVNAHDAPIAGPKGVAGRG